MGSADFEVQPVREGEVMIGFAIIYGVYLVLILIGASTLGRDPGHVMGQSSLP